MDTQLLEIVLKYGVGGGALVLLWKIIKILDKRQEDAKARLIKEIDEERSYSRSLISETIEMCKHSVDNNNKLLEDTRKSLDEVSRVLTNYWEQQLKK